jgi:hypothetical protein
VQEQTLEHTLAARRVPELVLTLAAKKVLVLARMLAARPVVTVAREPTPEHTVLESTVEQQLQLLLVNY